MILLHHLTYLFTILFFVGTALLILWSRDERILRKYELVILAITAISIPFAALDWFALKWHAWYYYPANTLNIHILTEVETYLFGAGVTCVTACATVVFAARIDREASAPKKSKRRSLRLRKFSLPAASARR